MAESISRLRNWLNNTRDVQGDNVPIVCPPNIFSEPTEAYELELELIQTQMTQKPMLRAEVGMRVRCANKASAE